MFDLELGKVCKWISDGGYASVAIQLPEGLKIRAPEISETIQRETGASALVVGRPCYGACDLFDYRGWADALVHFGHSRIPSMDDDPDVLYVEARSDAGLDGAEALLEGLPARVGVLATVQYLHLVPELCRMLEASGRTAVVGEGDARVAHPGQVLGCNCSAAEGVAGEVDCFVCIGEGAFHPLAAALGAGKDVYVLNPVTKEVSDMSEARDRLIRRRFAAVQSASSARTFLVVVCSKAGQCRRGLAEEAARMISEAGRSCVTAVMEEVTPDSLAPYRADAYVCTACPRVAMDESARYGKPMLTVPELEVALGLKEWESYPFDQIRGRPSLGRLDEPVHDELLVHRGQERAEPGAGGLADEDLVEGLERALGAYRLLLGDVRYDARDRVRVPDAVVHPLHQGLEVDLLGHGDLHPRRDGLEDRELDHVGGEPVEPVAHAGDPPLEPVEVVRVHAGDVHGAGEHHLDLLEVVGHLHDVNEVAEGDLHGLPLRDVVVLGDDVGADGVVLGLRPLAREVQALHPVVLVDHVEKAHAGVVVHGPRGVDPQELVVQDLRGRHVDGVQPGDGAAQGLVHLPHALELHELVGYGVGGLAAVDLGDYPLAGVVGAAGRRVVLAEGLRGGAEDHPLGGPLEPPGQLAVAGPDVRPPVVAAGAVVFHVGEAVGVEDGLGEPAALGADGVVRGVGGLGLLAGDLVQDPDDVVPLAEGLVYALGERALVVELVGPYDLAPHAERVDGVEEGLHEVVGVVPVPAAGAGDPADGHPHVLLELLWEEVVALAQGVERVDEVDQADVFAPGLNRAADGLARDGFPEAADVDDPRRAYSGGYQRVLAGVRDLLCNYVCPVHSNRAFHQQLVHRRFGPRGRVAGPMVRKEPFYTDLG